MFYETTPFKIQMGERTGCSPSLKSTKDFKSKQALCGKYVENSGFG
ncbi:MAG: hypothetical protein ACI9YB_000884 [Halioglobus sp.]|jgi:hypothetical protein